MNEQKKQVHDFWNKNSCGEKLYLDSKSVEGFKKEQKIRYELEPYILPFLNIGSLKDKRVLEIGVGLGADHHQLSMLGGQMFGIDLTKRAIKNTKTRFEKLKINSKLIVADAEKLPFENEYFDYIYSWGVLHHSPNTQTAINELHRVLKKGGKSRIMIYHKHSLVGIMLWFRYALLKLKPFLNLSYIYSNYLESPGTKAYTINESKIMFNKFKSVNIKIELSQGDLLTDDVGQRHKGLILKVAKMIWPTFLVKKLFKNYGLFMLISVEK